MNQPLTADRFSAGDDVFSADGEKIGTVAAVHMDHLLVEKGLLFVTDYHVPLSAVARYDEEAGDIHLGVTKEEALSSGWDAFPADDESALATSDTVLTGAASMPDTGNVIAELNEDDEPFEPDELAPA